MSESTTGAAREAREIPTFITETFGSPPVLPGFSGLEECWFESKESGSHLHYYASAVPKRLDKDGNNVDIQRPILMLAHGWPQTSYVWRYVIPALQNRIRLFVPDQPGIAHSTASQKGGSKMVLGRTYMEALAAHFHGPGPHQQGQRPTQPLLRVVLGGHDRGGRISQRLAVSRAEVAADFGVDIAGTVLLDIVPIVAQFAAFGADPRAAVRYNHWAWLPATAMSIPLIEAFGGDQLCRAAHVKMAGSDAAGAARTHADHGLEVYAAWYARADTNAAAVEDYRAAAHEDYDAMAADQAAGRKIDVPTLVLHGESLPLTAGGGPNADPAIIRDIWQQYVAPYAQAQAQAQSRLQVKAAPAGTGHNVQEEQPEWTLEQITGFLDLLGV